MYTIITYSRDSNYYSDQAKGSGYELIIYKPIKFPMTGLEENVCQSSS